MFSPVGRGVGSVLALAVGAAISPLPVIAVVLMLLSRRARTDGPSFLLGWALGLGAVSSVVYLVTDGAGASSGGNAGRGVSWGLIVLGVLLLAMAGRRWRRRPPPGVAPETPRWMRGIDSMTPLPAFGLAVVLAAAAPKNLVLSAGAGAALGQLGLTAPEVAVSLLVYVLVGSSTIGAPVVLYLTGGQRARAALEGFHGWLDAHGDAVLTVLLLVFGAVLVAKGLPPLTS